MHLTPLEIAPAGGAAADLLSPLIILTGLIFALGCVTLIRAFVQGVFAVIKSVAGHVPGIGGLVASALTGAEQGISNALGHAISGIEARIATNFHNMARAAHRLWEYQVGVAQNLWHLAQGFYSAVSLGDLKHLLHRFEASIHATERTIRRDVTKTVHSTVKRIEALGHHVLPRLHAVEHAIAQTIPREIKSTRELAREAERTAARAWDVIRAHPWTIPTTALVTAVAAALSLPSFEWFRCSAASNVFRRGCSGLWGDIEAILGLLADTVLLANVCTILPVLETAVSDVADPLVIALTDVGAGLCSGGIGPAPALSVPTLSLPANPGVTLSLP